MANHILSNEQKLDVIYDLLKKQEARQARKKWFILLKWTIFTYIIYFLATNPTFILEKVTTIMRPLIIENMKNMMDYEKSDIFQEMKKVLKESQTSQQ